MLLHLRRNLKARHLFGRILHLFRSHGNGDDVIFLKAFSFRGNSSVFRNNGQKPGIFSFNVAFEKICLADEGRHEFCRRRVVDFPRQPDLLKYSVMHNRDPVRHREGFLLIMRHVNERNVQLALQPLKFDLHLLAELKIQGSQRFIEEKHLRPVYKGPGDGDTLFLPARKLGRKTFLKTAHLHEIQHLRHTPRNLRFRNFFHFQAVCDVVVNIHMREERITLKHRIDVSFKWFLIVDILAFNADGAAGRFFKSCNHAQRRCFPAP